MEVGALNKITAPRALLEHLSHRRLTFGGTLRQSKHNLVGGELDPSRAPSVGEPNLVQGVAQVAPGVGESELPESVLSIAAWRPVGPRRSQGRNRPRPPSSPTLWNTSCAGGGISVWVRVPLVPWNRSLRARNSRGGSASRVAATHTRASALSAGSRIPTARSKKGPCGSQDRPSAREPCATPCLWRFRWSVATGICASATCWRVGPMCRWWNAVRTLRRCFCEPLPEAVFRPGWCRPRVRVHEARQTLRTHQETGSHVGVTCRANGSGQRAPCRRRNSGIATPTG